MPRCPSCLAIRSHRNCLSGNGPSPQHPARVWRCRIPAAPPPPHACVRSPGTGVRALTFGHASISRDDWFFLLPGPPGDPESHLPTLADIARFVSDDALRQRILDAGHPGRLLDVIQASQMRQGRCRTLAAEFQWGWPRFSDILPTPEIRGMQRLRTIGMPPVAFPAH